MDAKGILVFQVVQTIIVPAATDILWATTVIVGVPVIAIVILLTAGVI